MVIEDLIGLKVIGAIQSAEAREHYLLNDMPMPIHKSGTKLVTRYAFTHYGLAFLRAVSRKAKKASE